ncbi:transposase, partial [bacterium M00.F.Ca.ET.205.01.1.1]
NDGVTNLEPMNDRLPSPAGLFDLIETDVAAFDALRKAESVGRPVGGEAFQNRIAEQTGRVVKPGKRGRRQQANSALSP